MADADGYDDNPLITWIVGCMQQVDGLTPENFRSELGLWEHRANGTGAWGKPSAFTDREIEAVRVRVFPPTSNA